MRCRAAMRGAYLHWFAREGFPRGEIGQLLALMYELDHNGLRDLLAPLRAAPGR
ncbi:MAG: putative quorum-sensing-regulated virulence factor [Diaphorobacter nitroreducens]